jgi:hypothetical protein
MRYFTLTSFFFPILGGFEFKGLQDINLLLNSFFLRENDNLPGDLEIFYFVVC